MRDAAKGAGPLCRVARPRDGGDVVALTFPYRRLATEDVRRHPLPLPRIFARDLRQAWERDGGG